MVPHYGTAEDTKEEVRETDCNIDCRTSKRPSHSVAVLHASLVYAATTTVGGKTDGIGILMSSKSSDRTRVVPLPS